MREGVVVPETNHTKSTGVEKFGSPGIVTLSVDVLATIKFNNQSAFDAGKVCDVGADHVLTPELVPC